MSASGKTSTIINLDDADTRSALVVMTFEGAPVALTRNRLEDLLRIERKFLTQMLDGSPRPTAPTARARPSEAPAPERTGETPQFKPEDIPMLTISHASLSMRIKKIHGYSASAKALRPAQLAMLSEILTCFDWVIPTHPNTKLERHLVELLSWRGVTNEFRDQASKFLERYLKARRATQ